MDLEDYQVDREHRVEEHHPVLQEEHLVAEEYQMDLQQPVEPAPQPQAAGAVIKLRTHAAPPKYMRGRTFEPSCLWGAAARCPFRGFH